MHLWQLLGCNNADDGFMPIVQVRLQKSMDNLNQKADIEHIRKTVLENLRQLSFAPGLHTESGALIEVSWVATQSVA
jgi:hypothetical protein